MFPFWKRPKVLAWYRPPAWLLAMTIFFIAFSFSLLAQASPAFKDADSFYHMKVTELMLSRGIVRDFPWLPQTVLADNYIDHHFLYHVILMPFLAVFGPEIGMVFATAFLAGLTLAAFYYLLRDYRVRWPFLFTLFLALARTFSFRLSNPKAVAVSILTIIAGLWCARRRYQWGVFAVGFIYVWMYDAWPLLIAVMGARLVARGAVEVASGGWRVAGGEDRAGRILRWAGKIWAWVETKSFFAALGGILAGIVINPYFPRNLGFYWEHIIQIAAVNRFDLVSVGAEWYPLKLSILPRFVGLPFWATAAAVMAFILIWLLGVRQSGGWRVGMTEPARSDGGGVKEVKRLEMYAAVLTTAGFFFMTLRNRRHNDYFSPFLVLTTALLWTHLIDRYDWRVIWDRLELVGRRTAAATVLAVLLAASFVGWQTVRETRNTMVGGSYGWQAAAGACEWLNANVPDGTVIFNSNWDWFTAFMSCADGFSYITGLDPTFLYRADPLKYILWANLIYGRVPKDVAKLIVNEFGAHYAVFRQNHGFLKPFVDTNPRFHLEYSDKVFRVYRID